MSNENFGAHLRRIRKSRNITQSDFSRMLNISRQAYSNYEQGRCVPTVTTLIDMSIILNSNLLSCFLSEEEIPFLKKSSFGKPDTPDIPEFEKNALMTLYKSLDLDDRMSIVETMLIKSCRK